VIVIGLMSGTSVDGIDAAVVDVSSRDDALVVRVLDYAESPIDDDLRQRIYTQFNPEQSRVDEICEINVLIGEAFANAAKRALERARTRADLVASHGQTVWHQVAPGQSSPNAWV
jgi:anhydro-N-acetylmuramic acid kinase